jgi:hypothetical protein
MRVILAGLALIVAAACGPRQVETGTGTVTGGTEPTLHVTNNASQAVNVYVVSGGQETFVDIVPARSDKHLVVRGVAPGSSVVLQAKLADGSRTYTRNATLSGMFSWTVP